MLSTLWILAGLGALWWGWQALCLARTMRTVHDLPRSDWAPRSADVPFVTVIAPARDEGDVIEHTTRARLRETAGWIEFIFVNDRSTDGTGDLLEAVSDGDARARAVHVESLPEGWLGKVYAQQVGIEHARCPEDGWYLFSDGDTIVEPGAVAAALSWAQQEGADHVALTPRILGGPWLLRLCLVSLMRVLIGALRLWRANDDASRAHMGVGAFNLVRRRALERAGGMVELRLEVADDVGMAQIVAESGGRSRLASGLEWVSIEWYRTTRQLLEGSEKGAAKARTRAGLLLGGVVATLAVAVEMSPWVVLAWLPAGPAWLALVVAIGSIGVNLVVAGRFGLPIWSALVGPAGTLAAGVLALRAVMLAFVRGGIRWRGDVHTLKSTAEGERVRL